MGASGSSPENLFDEIYLRIIYLGQKSFHFHNNDVMKMTVIVDDARIRRKRINVLAYGANQIRYLLRVIRSMYPRAKRLQHYHVITSAEHSGGGVSSAYDAAMASAPRGKARARNPYPKQLSERQRTALAAGRARRGGGGGKRRATSQLNRRHVEEMDISDLPMDLGF